MFINCECHNSVKQAGGRSKEGGGGGRFVQPSGCFTMADRYGALIYGEALRRSVRPFARSLVCPFELCSWPDADRRSSWLHATLLASKA